MNILWLFAIIIGLVIIVALAIYAKNLLSQVKAQQQKQQENKHQHQQALHQHDTKILRSVVIIVRAMKEEQCDFSEGCWRISVLLDSLKTSQDHQQKFQAIFTHYEKIKHLSILDARKNLVKQQRMKEDLQRMKLEAEMQPAIIADLELLHQYANKRLAELEV